MGDPPTFQYFFIIRQPSFGISIPALPILRKNYRKILCKYDHVETPFCVISRYQLGRDETTELAPVPRAELFKAGLVRDLNSDLKA